MPIKPENKHRYPKNWKEISLRIRARAGNCCEGCGVKNGSYKVRKTGTFIRKVKIVLTCAHLDHTPENCADENLRAWCQRCHNIYDLPHRRRSRASK